MILATGFHRADGIASLVVAAIMLRAAYSLLRASGRVFLEAAPEGIDVNAIGHTMAAQPSVAEVHDLHVWEVTSGFPALSAHVLVGAGDDCHAARRRLEWLLAERFDIEHTTLQVDHEGGELLTIERPEPRNPLMRCLRDATCEARACPVTVGPKLTYRQTTPAGGDRPGQSYPPAVIAEPDGASSHHLAPNPSLP